MAGTKGVARGPGSLVAPAGRVRVVGEKSCRRVVFDGSLRRADRHVHAMVPDAVAAAVRALRFDLGTHGDLPGTCEGAGSRRRAGSPVMDTAGVKPPIQTSC